MAAECGKVEGNIAYASPESINLFDEAEQRLVGTPSDMWTVGCLLLELLTGQPAFIGSDLLCQPTDQQAGHIRQRQRQWVSASVAKLSSSIHTSCMIHTCCIFVPD